MSTWHYLRHGVPWLVVAAAAIPSLAIVAGVVAYHDRDWATTMLRAGLMLLAIPASFVLDEPLGATVDASPRSPWWVHMARLGVVAALVALIASVVLAWDRSWPMAQPVAVALVAAGAVLVAVAAASVMRVAGYDAPGDLVASATGMTVIVLHRFSPHWGDWTLLPFVGQASALDITFWCAVCAVALGVAVTTPARRTGTWSLRAGTKPRQASPIPE